MKARIAEIFDSVQGEGLYMGQRQLFVRFFSCNLVCRFCDTKLREFKEYSPADLFSEIKACKRPFQSISFTGGEPLLQKDFLREALRLTQRAGYTNYLETNGTLAGELEEVIEYLDIIAMDLKLPSSCGMGYLWGLHRRFLKIASKKELFLKTVICQATREDDLREALKLIAEIDSSLVLVLQPNSYENHNALDEKLNRFKEISQQAQINACIIPQMHKVIGVR